ncbi:MAG TPA: aspartate/glutamate racemase family protein [Bellilinea sp.]|nr:aspartate/glutamate racemase family protein [Bellilinea sp.]
MKTIGLLGGLTWESTLEYYRLINEHVRDTLGGLHSAKLLLYSLDFAEIEHLQQTNEREKIPQLLIHGAKALKAGSADFLVICANTMHKYAPEVLAAVDLPLVHIADVTGEAVAAAGVQRVGLLGTKYTMEEDFYKQRLADKFGLEVLIPPEADRQLVHQVIFRELSLGVIRDESRGEYLRIIDELVQRGAQAIILGCTEIGLLVKQVDTPHRLFDTTVLHAVAAAERSVEG